MCSSDLSWTASTDNVGVAGYDIYRNGTKINTNLVTTTNYGDAGLAANTTYNYYVVAKDTTGNQSAASNTVQVITPAPDTAPTVSITNPLNGNPVTGSVSITVNATDDKGVTKVEYFVDGLSIGTSTTSPYTTVWDSTKVTNGSHSIRARATDTIGQIGDSAKIGRAHV